MKYDNRWHAREAASKKSRDKDKIIAMCAKMTIENVAKLLHMKSEHIREILYAEQMRKQKLNCNCHTEDDYNDDIPF